MQKRNNMREFIFFFFGATEIEYDRVHHGRHIGRVQEVSEKRGKSIRHNELKYLN